MLKVKPTADESLANLSTSDLDRLATFAQYAEEMRDVLTIHQYDLDYPKNRDEKFRQVFDMYFNPTKKGMRGAAELAKLTGLKLATIRTYLSAARRSITSESLELVIDVARKEKYPLIINAMIEELDLENVVEKIKLQGGIGVISEAIEHAQNKGELSAALNGLKPSLYESKLAVSAN